MLRCSNPKAQYLAYRAEIDDAIQRVLNSGRYILGPECESFENEFRDWLGAAHCVGVANGTDALRLTLWSCGIGEGDEVIAPSHTAVATIAAIELAGAVPVFVDIEPHSFTLDHALVPGAITKKTRAVIAVHLYGHAADVEGLSTLCREKGLRFIEDCAQATGTKFRDRKIGTFGDASAFSFYPTKNLGALGDGGMVVFRDADLAEKCRMLRQY